LIQGELGACQAKCVNSHKIRKWIEALDEDAFDKKVYMQALKKYGYLLFPFTQIYFLSKAYDGAIDES